jgi:hypothetical protein
MERYSTTATEGGTERDSDSGLLDVTNVSITPYTYSEDFTGNDAVLSRDNLKIAFRVDTVWRHRQGGVRAFHPRAASYVRPRRGPAAQRPRGQKLPMPSRVSSPRHGNCERKDTEIEIERKERTKREVQAQRIADGMQIIRGQLSAMYIQHEAIEAQKAMVNSPNHTVVYIPVGPMGVPLTGTFSTVPASTTAAVPAQ